MPAARADGTAAVNGRIAPSATVFRRPLNGEDAADGAHLRWADPVNESRDGGGRGPPATPQDAVTVRDADLSQEVDRRAGRRDGRAVLEGGLLDGDEDLLSLVQVSVVAASDNDDEGVGRSSSEEEAESGFEEEAEPVNALENHSRDGQRRRGTGAGPATTTVHQSPAVAAEAQRTAGSARSTGRSATREERRRRSRMRPTTRTASPPPFAPSSPARTPPRRRWRPPSPASGPPRSASAGGGERGLVVVRGGGRVSRGGVGGEDAGGDVSRGERRRGDGGSRRRRRGRRGRHGRRRDVRQQPAHNANDSIDTQDLLDSYCEDEHEAQESLVAGTSGSSDAEDAPAGRRQGPVAAESDSTFADDVAGEAVVGRRLVRPTGAEGEGARAALGREPPLTTPPPLPTSRRKSPAALRSRRAPAPRGRYRRRRRGLLRTARRRTLPRRQRLDAGARTSSQPLLPPSRPIPRRRTSVALRHDCTSMLAHPCTHPRWTGRLGVSPK